MSSWSKAVAALEDSVLNERSMGFCWVANKVRSQVGDLGKKRLKGAVFDPLFSSRREGLLRR